VALCPSKILSTTATRRRQHRPEFSFPDGESRLQRPQHAGTIISTPRPRTRTAGCIDCSAAAIADRQRLLRKQGRPTHQPTKQSCSDLQATAQEAPRVTAPHTPTHVSNARTRTRIRIRIQARAASKSHADLQEYDLQRVMGAHTHQSIVPQPTVLGKEASPLRPPTDKVGKESTPSYRRQVYRSTTIGFTKRPATWPAQCTSSKGAKHKRARHQPTELKG